MQLAQGSNPEQALLVVPTALPNYMRCINEVMGMAGSQLEAYLVFPVGERANQIWRMYLDSRKNPPAGYFGRRCDDLEKSDGLGMAGAS